MLYYFFAIFIALTYLWLIVLIYNGWQLVEEKVTDATDIKMQYSILIPARNEAANIEACLSSLQNLSYDKNDYEIILINDHSEDETKEKAMNFANIKVLNLENGRGKKYGLTYGISHAKFNHIVCLDADCRVEKDWLNSINTCFVKYKADLVVGMVAIEKNASPLSIFEFYETAAMMAITANGIARNVYFIANGANMAFKKSMFLELNGFQNNHHFASGDDVFLINEARKHNKKIVHMKSAKATVTTKPQSDFHSLLEQRKRWATKTKAYANTDILFVQGIVFGLSLYIVLGLLTGPFWCMCFFLSALIVLAIKMIVDYVFLKKMSSYFNETDMKNFLPSFFIYLFMIIFMGFQAIFPSNIVWKGREVK